MGSRSHSQQGVSEGHKQLQNTPAVLLSAVLHLWPHSPEPCTSPGREKEGGREEGGRVTQSRHKGDAPGNREGGQQGCNWGKKHLRTTEQGHNDRRTHVSQNECHVGIYKALCCELTTAQGIASLSVKPNLVPISEKAVGMFKTEMLQDF